MEIVVGASPRVGGSRPVSNGYGGIIEAKVLNVRPSRKRNSLAINKDRRSRKAIKDSQNGNVMVLFVPDEQSLPRDLATENYRVVLRFIPRKK